MKTTVLTFLAAIVLNAAVLYWTAWNAAGLVLAVVILAVGLVLHFAPGATASRAELVSVSRGLLAASSCMLVTIGGMYAWLSLYMNGVI